VGRVHRAGEGASYTGLKPAGLSTGPVIPLAERAVETGSPEPVATFLTGVLHDHTGTYTLAFQIAIACSVVSAVAIWLAAPRKVRVVSGRLRARA
jgi:hypothetical protein